MNPHRYRFVLLILTLGLAACASNAAGTPTAAIPAATQTLAAAANTQDSTVGPAPTGLPPQSDAAEIRPPERRAELLRLSAWLDFQVNGPDGAKVGQVNDFIVNTCETYIIYTVMEPVPELGIADGHRLVFPFEAVTINSGALDVAAKAIVLPVVSAQLTAAPVFPDPLELFPTDWEEGVRGYWSPIVRLGKLSTACAAGGDTANPVHKIAYARDLLAAQIKDGNQQLLGTVQEITVEPETGKLRYYMVKLESDQGLVLVPLAKTNIPEAVLQPGIKPELVLLADASQLQGAPRLASLEEAATDNAQNSARGYWGE
jgi:sporulation protein YlmC with PRC-barrel domain